MMVSRSLSETTIHLRKRTEDNTRKVRSQKTRAKGNVMGKRERKTQGRVRPGTGNVPGRKLGSRRRC
eukprot:1916932-Heterocapsa_arctica.AAC.1